MTFGELKAQMAARLNELQALAEVQSAAGHMEVGRALVSARHDIRTLMTWLERAYADTPAAKPRPPRPKASPKGKRNGARGG